MPKSSDAHRRTLQVHDNAEGTPKFKFGMPNRVEQSPMIATAVMRHIDPEDVRPGSKQPLDFLWRT